MRVKTAVLIIILTIAVSLTFASSASATDGGQGTLPNTTGNTPNTTGNNPNTTGNSGQSTSIEVPNLLKCSEAGKSDLECLVDRIFSFLWILAFPIVTLMIMWGAYQLMTSQGNEEKVTKARQTITYAIIGFVVLILARSVAYLITNLLSSLGK